MNENLEYYKVFYQVAGCGSITQAAEKLCITQPAVSQAVRQLETVLDCKLFLRTPKGVSLTKEGSFLYEYVKRGLEEIWRGEAGVRRLQKLETGEVHIGASDMTLQFYLLPFLERFHQDFPGVKVRVSNAPTPETLKLLNQGVIDFGVVSTPFEAAPHSKSIPVKAVRNVFVGGHQFQRLQGSILEYEVLREHPCIFLEKCTSTRAFTDQWLLKKNVVVEPEFELATSEMIVQFAIRNMGIGNVVEEFARPYLENEVLFELEFSEKMPERHFCIVTDKKNPISLAGRYLLQLMTEGENSDLDKMGYNSN